MSATCGFYSHPARTPAPSHTLNSRVVRPKSSNEAKTLLNPVPLPPALRPSRKSGQLRNRRNDPRPTRLTLSCNLVRDPPNRTVWAPRTKLRPSLKTKLFCVIVRGNPEAILTEPRIFKLGSSLLSAHFSFGNANVRPIERSPGLRAGPRADISNPRFVEPSAAESVSMGKRKDSEARIAGTRKPRDVACRIEAITGKRDGLIIICQEEPDCDFAVRPSEVVNIGGKLVFAEMAWFREH